MIIAVRDLIDAGLRRATGDPEFLRSDAKFMRTVDEIFRLATGDYMAGASAVEISMRAADSFQTVLHGKQFAFLGTMASFARLMFKQEMEAAKEQKQAELQEGYRIVSGAEAERLLRTMERA